MCTPHMCVSHITHINQCTHSSTYTYIYDIHVHTCTDTQKHCTHQHTQRHTQHTHTTYNIHRHPFCRKKCFSIFSQEQKTLKVITCWIPKGSLSACWMENRLRVFLHFELATQKPFLGTTLCLENIAGKDMVHRYDKNVGFNLVSGLNSWGKRQTLLLLNETQNTLGHIYNTTHTADNTTQHTADNTRHATSITHITHVHNTAQHTTHNTCNAHNTQHTIHNTHGT